MKDPQLPAKASLRLLVIFLFLGLADFFLTWKLLSLHETDIIESNPLASLILKSAGWVGLGCFKLTLMLLIYGLAMLIERQRTFGGFFILIFGCGAQASIVITSIFMYLEKTNAPETIQTRMNNGITARSTFPASALPLLGKPSVQAELCLTSTQLDSVSRLAKDRHEIARMMLVENIEDWQSRLSDLIVREQHFVFQELRPAQFKRLHQLCWQYRGPLTVLDADYPYELDLTVDQIEVINPLIEKGNRLLIVCDAATTDVDRARQEILQIKQQIWSALTAQQRETWQKFAGMAFSFDEQNAAPVFAEHCLPLHGVRDGDFISPPTTGFHHGYRNGRQ